MATSPSEASTQRWALDQTAAASLREQNILRDLDRAGHPHFVVKVPDLSQALEADLGLEVDRAEDGCVALSVLLYDIPTEPVSYDLRLYPDQPDDLRFLRQLLENKGFRLRPCQASGESWAVGPALSFRLPPNMVLRLKHLSQEWPGIQPATTATAAASADQEALARAPRTRSPDPRDTVIRKLKEQVQALRAQVQERDKRIIELEDELHEIRSKGRSYKLTGERKPWWRPF